MATVILFLSSLLCVNPPAFDNVTIDVEGYIEINHKWDEEQGELVFDQLIVWQYNERFDEYDILHFCLIKDGRESLRVSDRIVRSHIDLLLYFVPPSEAKDQFIFTAVSTICREMRDESKNKVKQKRARLAIEFAKQMECKPDEIVVCVAEDWLGSRVFNRADYNNTTGRYETICNVYNMQIKFTAKTFVETNTSYDPELDFRYRRNSQLGTPFGSGKTRSTMPVPVKDLFWNTR